MSLFLIEVNLNVLEWSVLHVIVGFFYGYIFFSCLNKNINSGIIAFNIDGVFAQDSSMYLNHYGIAVRAGNHCAKMLKDEMDIKNTVRISMYFYNTYEEIDKVIDVLKNSKDIFKVIL